jgi:hypothetical protein
MKVYIYDSNTYEYLKALEAELDPLETKAAGEPIYVLPAHATFIAPPQLGPNEVAVFNEKMNKWILKTSYKGQYKVNLNTGVVSKIENNLLLKADEILMTKEQFEAWEEDPLQFEIINKKLVNIANTQQYQVKYNIKKYEKLIRQAKADYDKFRETPVAYTNGQYYLPRYVDDYAKLALKQFPMEIWDATGLHSQLMSSTEFNALRRWLEDLDNRAYKIKKETIKRYTLEID